jgi:chromate transporter
MMDTTQAPATLWAMFLAFNRLSLQGFGGVIAVAQRELVERLGWLSREQFVEMLSLAQVLPGPNVVNLALMIGDRFFGTRGALTAMAGMLVVPSMLVLALTAAYAEFAQHPVVSSALRSMGAVAAGLITATALRLLVTLKSNALGAGWCAAVAAATFAAVAWLHWPMVVVVLGIGGTSLGLAWYRLKHALAAGAGAGTGAAKGPEAGP